MSSVVSFSDSAPEEMNSSQQMWEMSTRNNVSQANESQEENDGKISVFQLVLVSQVKSTVNVLQF